MAKVKTAETTMSKADAVRAAVEALGEGAKPAAIIKWAADTHDIELSASNVWSVLNPASARKGSKDKVKAGLSADDMLSLHKLATKVTAEDCAALADMLDRAGIEEVNKMLSVLAVISAPQVVTTPSKSK